MSIAMAPSFFKAAAELGLEGIVSKRPASLYRGGPSRNWLKTKNMVEGEFILLGTERDSDGVPWALLASDRDGRLEFAGPAILNPPQALRAAWRERMAALAVATPPLRGLRQGSGQWLRPELRVRVKASQGQGRAAACDCEAAHRLIIDQGRAPQKAQDALRAFRLP
jgi:bifunctional non-homologous end joining protein LigD